MKNKAKVQQGKIVFGNNQQYQLLVLPDNTAMEWETLQRIAEMVQEGAIVYGPKPTVHFSTKS